MPCGPYYIRRAENDFRAERPRTDFMSQYDWMDWESLKRKVHVRHRLNSGRETYLFNHACDGVATQEKLVLEYNGCW
jgi:hypothetical protein